MVGLLIRSDASQQTKPSKTRETWASMKRHGRHRENAAVEQSLLRWWIVDMKRRPPPCQQWQRSARTAACFGRSDFDDAADTDVLDSSRDLVCRELVGAAADGRSMMRVRFCPVVGGLLVDDRGPTIASRARRR